MMCSVAAVLFVGVLAASVSARASALVCVNDKSGYTLRLGAGSEGAGVRYPGTLTNGSLNVILVRSGAIATGKPHAPTCQAHGLLR